MKVFTHKISRAVNAGIFTTREADALITIVLRAREEDLYDPHIAVLRELKKQHTPYSISCWSEDGA